MFLCGAKRRSHCGQADAPNQRSPHQAILAAAEPRCRSLDNSLVPPAIRGVLPQVLVHPERESRAHATVKIS
jgi:hypothetical protein